MIHRSYYILVNKNDSTRFLNYDKEFTTTLRYAEEFSSIEEAGELINFYRENEQDECYASDYLISNQLVIRKVEIIIS